MSRSSVAVFGPALIAFAFGTSAHAATGTLVTGKNPEYQFKFSGATTAPGKKATFTGRGQLLLKGNILLTSGEITNISKTSIRIGKLTFAIDSSTKVCGADGEPQDFALFKAGDLVKTTSQPGGTNAVTLRKGLATLSGYPPRMDVDRTYDCK
jgi:hypothetical protein